MQKNEGMAQYREWLRRYTRTTQSEYEETRFRTNGEAVEAFLDSYDQLDFGGFQISAGDADALKLVLSEVEVSVRPEFVVRGNHRGRDCVGAVKLYFSKEDPLDENSAPYITAVVARYVQKHLVTDDAIVRTQNCCVFDIFARRAHRAPGAVVPLCRRSWIGFFRTVDDLQQIRGLDRWIRRQVSKFMWEKYRKRVTFRTMQDFGLPSLVNCLWKARSPRSRRLGKDGERTLSR